MTRLLKPLFHNPAALLTPNVVTPPPSMSSLSCSPAPPLLTQSRRVDGSDERTRPGVLMPEPSSPQQEAFRGEFDPCSPPRHYPPLPHLTDTPPHVSHCSAPPSLNSSPHEHAASPHLYSSSSIPSLFSSSRPSSINPLLMHLSGPGIEPQSHLQLLSQSESQLQFHPHSQFMSQSSLSQPHLQPLLQPSRPREPILNLQEMEWGGSPAQLSFVDEGQPTA